MANGSLLQYGQPSLNGANTDYSNDPWTSPADTFVITVNDATRFSFQAQDWNCYNYITFSFDVSKYASTTALGASSATSAFGGDVTLTATVTPADATGTVTFMDGADTLGTGTLNGGVATLDTTTLPVGVQTITAEYGGDGSYDGSTSSSVTVTVGAAATTTALITSSASPGIGDTVTLTATVTPTASTGTVTFMDGTSALGTGTLSGGVATLATASLATGAHDITATYGGDASYGGSTSPSVTVTVGVHDVASAFSDRADKVKAIMVAMARQSLQSFIDSDEGLARQARTDFIESKLHGSKEAAGSVPFGVDAATRGTESKVTSKGTFFQRNSSADGSRNQVFFGNFNYVSGHQGTSTAMLNAKLAWDTMISDRAKIGYYVGADFGRSVISGDFAGAQQHSGLSVGAYGVYQLDRTTFLDGFASIGAGLNSLGMADDTLDLASTYGTHSAIVGGALTTTLAEKSFEFWPELAFSYGTTSIGKVGLTGRAYDLLDDTLSLDAGSVTIANIMLRPEFRVPLDGVAAPDSLDLLTLTPRFVCQWDKTTVTRRDCGAGVEIGLTRQWNGGLGQLSAKLVSEHRGGMTQTGAQLSVEQRF